MFDETIVVQSAVSAFNNAALYGPAFLWYALLALPLFALVYFYGKAFVARIGWTQQNITRRACLWTVILTLAWIILFGGNYGVLRDAQSVLPFVVAVISFLASLFIGSHTRDIKLPAWRTASRRRKLGIVGTGLLLAGAIGLSDTHAWWGPVLQIGAVLGGLIAGRAAKCEMRTIAGTLLIVFTATIAILMQPEFFRFGQLGALTVFHLIGLICMGAAVAATAACANIPSRGRIHRSAYVKLKWMARFITMLAIALFMLTESVPIFLGMTAMFFVMFALSIWHADKMPSDLAERMLAIALGVFGIITTMPVITALGIVCWTAMPRCKFWAQAKFLL